jgi:hypothetical protein
MEKNIERPACRASVQRIKKVRDGADNTRSIKKNKRKERKRMKA